MARAYSFCYHIPIRSVALLGLTALLSASSFSQADTLAITNRQHPLTNFGAAQVIFLDDLQHLEEQLSERLPSNPYQAMAILQ
jgi:uncharacterized protein YcaQ